MLSGQCNVISLHVWYCVLGLLFWKVRIDRQSELELQLGCLHVYLELVLFISATRHGVRSDHENFNIEPGKG